MTIDEVRAVLGAPKWTRASEAIATEFWLYADDFVQGPGEILGAEL